jgi:hypothetical protein
MTVTKYMQYLTTLDDTIGYIRKERILQGKNHKTVKLTIQNLERPGVLDIYFPSCKMTLEH